VPKRWEGQKGAPGILAWLLDSYDISLAEDRLAAAKKSGGKQRRELLALCRECIVNHTALLISELPLFDPSYTPTIDTLLVKHGARTKHRSKPVSSR